MKASKCNSLLEHSVNCSVVYEFPTPNPLTLQTFISESNQIFTSANELPCLSDLHCTRKLNHWQRKRLLNLMISHKLLATVNFKPPPPSHFKYLFLKVITFFMWLSSWFGHYYSKTQQMTHKHQNAKFFGGQGNHRFLSNFLNTPCNSEFQTPPPSHFKYLFLKVITFSHLLLNSPVFCPYSFKET